jgi:hypothetical protein
MAPNRVLVMSGKELFRPPLPASMPYTQRAVWSEMKAARLAFP